MCQAAPRAFEPGDAAERTADIYAGRHRENKIYSNDDRHGNQLSNDRVKCTHDDNS